MTKKYLLYLWNKTHKFVFIALLVFVLLYPVTILVTGTPYMMEYYVPTFDVTEGYYDQIPSGFRHIRPEDTKLFMLTILAMVSAYLIPIIVQGTFQNKKRCDNLFSLPIKREKQIFLTSAYGFVMFLAIWWITALLGLGASFIVNLRYNVGYFFLYLLVMSVLALGVYGMTSLFVSLMRNPLDSILILAIVMLLPVAYNFMADQFYYEVTNTTTFSYDSEKFFLFSAPIKVADHLTCFFQQEVAYYQEGLREFILTHGEVRIPTEGGGYYVMYNNLFRYSFGASETIALVEMLVFGIASYGTSFVLWKNVRAEQMQTPATEWYTHPLFSALIATPIFYLLNVFSNFEGTFFLLNAIGIVAFFVASFIFQRKIKFTKANIISFAISFGLANILAIVSMLI